MPTAKKRGNKTAPIVLLVEEHVIVRLALAGHLRSCGFTVFEAATSLEARSVLLAGPKIDMLMADARLAGPDSGFALAQWVRRHRPGVEVILTGVLSGKALAATELCEKHSKRTTPQDGPALTERIRVMLAEHERRTRRPSSSARLIAPTRRAGEKSGG